MSALLSLKSARDLSELATLLQVKPKNLSYIIYKTPTATRYTSWKIQKSNGSTRDIWSPAPPLKLIQSRLADILQAAQSEIEAFNDTPPISHGFHPGRSILTNCARHTGKRFVLNVDLKDFFPSINFGRVRNFFIKNHDFQLEPKVATAIAQISCHLNQLPQGSPTSPVISNLICASLDRRLLLLAKRTRSEYTRYADDLTFSSNHKGFPAGLVKTEPSTGKWKACKRLRQEISRSGFQLNPDKTRIYVKNGRQLVTGLTANKKPNVRSEYFRLTRSMLRSLMYSGKYTIKPSLGSRHQCDPSMPPHNGPMRLEGIISHIHNVKTFTHRAPLKGTDDQWKAWEMSLPGRKLFSDFFLYKNFLSHGTATIITEGASDPVYIRSAIKALAADFPRLAKTSGTGASCLPQFLEITSENKSFMNLKGRQEATLGTHQLGNLVLEWLRPTLTSVHKHALRLRPVIVLLDNDSAGESVMKRFAGKFKKKISKSTTTPFYHLFDNVYLVKTPEKKGINPDSYIEELFDKATLETKLSGKTFDPINEKIDPNKSYGKIAFATQVVQKNISTIDFSGFTPLLERIDAVVEDFDSKHRSTP